jgi:hypothetical protein
MLKIDGYTIDAEILGEPQYENVLADFPVEEGEDRTDHAYATPLMFDVEGVVSDSPLGAVAVAREQFTLIDGEAFARPSDEARAKLVSLWKSRLPVTIESATGTYQNMVLVRLSPPRDKSTGKALRFRATFRQVTFTTSDRSSARIELPRAKGKKNLGFKDALQAIKNVTGVDFSVPITSTAENKAGRITSSTLTTAPPAPSDSFTEETSSLASRRPVRVGGSGFRTPLATGGEGF